MAGEQVVMSTVFVAGLLSFFAPCILPLLPVYVGILMGDAQNRKTFKISKLTIDVIKIIRTLSFVGGLSTSFIILGFGAGAIGSLISSRWFLILAGVVVVILGIHQTGLIEISVLERQRKLELKGSRRKDVLGTYLLGFTFSFGWTPCIGPILGAVLGISASGGQATYGAWLMLIYAIGLAMPFLIISIFSDLLLVKMKVLNKHMGKIKVVGGILIMIMGLLLMTDNLNLITVFFKSL
jgi:cytochrome c-type biogenesis protein